MSRLCGRSGRRRLSDRLCSSRLSKFERVHCVVVIYTGKFVADVHQTSARAATPRRHLKKSRDIYDDLSCDGAFCSLWSPSRSWCVARFHPAAAICSRKSWKVIEMETVKGRGLEMREGEALRKVLTHRTTHDNTRQKLHTPTHPPRNRLTQTRALARGDSRL